MTINSCRKCGADNFIKNEIVAIDSATNANLATSFFSKKEWEKDLRIWPKPAA